MDSKSKESRYQRLFGQLSELLKTTDFQISQMATICAVLHNKIEYFFWTGFYLLQNGELMVVPYQGPLACQKLSKDTGVCWAGINQRKTIIVSDVHKFPGHIACNSNSKSEIVIPLFDKNDIVIGVLDVDSKDYNSFDETDKIWLEKICKLINT